MKPKSNDRTKQSRGKTEMIKSLYATIGDQGGEINLQWDAVNDAYSYVIQFSYTETKKNAWKHIDIVNDSKYTVRGLKPERTYAFRIAVVGKNGQGEWSEPIYKKTQLN
jgi:hypothetical protein